ncbi:MAG: WD40 repeat domain-containing protein [Saprospiraceae bacterium]|nr:WD40 repeat domain-containing protein [Saprospiraceae bacterium]
MRLCLALFCLLPLFLSAQPGADSRRRYEPTLEFLNFKGDRCFEITRKEADRAFSLRYWEDASLLYRAAKNCSDADQTRRQEMNVRIEKCRTTAENALRQKELEARMQARQSEADKLANDAQLLLRNYDRTTAFRLADFANSYVAPPESGGNPECRQAILDAWNYEPYLQSTYKAEYAGLQVPFCFELANNMGSNVSLRFATRRDTQVLYAFMPEKKLLFAWKTDAFVPEAPIPLDASFLTMDILNDQETLLFRTESGFVLWRSISESRAIAAPKAALYYHEQETNRFYYYDNVAGEIRMVDLSKDAYSNIKFQQQQQQQNQKADRNKNVEETVVYVPDSMNLQNFAVFSGQLWMAFSDAVVIWSLEESTTLEVMPFERPIRQYGIQSMHLQPQLNSLIVAFDSATYFYYLPEGADSVPPPINQTQTKLLSDNPMGMHVATTMNTSGWSSFMYVQNKTDGVFRLCALNQLYDEFAVGSGDFSQSLQWFAAPTSTGTIKLWELFKTGATSVPFLVSNAGGVAFSPSGSKYALLVRDSLMLFETGNNEVPMLTQACEAGSSFVDLNDQWIVWQHGEDVLRLQRINGKGTSLSFPGRSSDFITSAFSSDETEMAFSLNDTVFVVSLLDGKLKQRQVFEGMVTHLAFVSGSHRLMVVHMRPESQWIMGGEYAVKLWHTDRRERPAILRLPQYNIQYVAVSDLDGWLAFSDGVDVRIYNMDKPEEEWSKIRTYKNYEISAMAFVPGTATVAPGYINGEVVFWDASQARFLNRVAPPDAYNRTVKGIYFSPREKNMLQHFSDNEKRSDASGNYYETGTYQFRNLDPEAMRRDLITPTRRLVSFSTDQIRDYDLEAALQYAGNFERLSQSRDLPLIRSFFNYYAFEAENSNNIERVQLYTKRATVLYEALNADSRVALRPNMVEMYKVLGWKLLLRNKSTEAETVGKELRSKFGEIIEATRLEAHAALLRGDCQTASRRYVDWFMRSQGNYGPTDFYLPTFYQLNENATQFNEYGLLDGAQQECLCALMVGTELVSTFCENIGTELQPAFDAPTKMRWEVYTGLRKAQTIKNKENKIASLEATLRQAQNLARTHPQAYQNDVQQVMMSLASAWYQYGVFERNNTLSLQYYQNARELLSNGSDTDTARLAKLALFQWAIGTTYFEQNNLLKAAAETEKGLQYAEILLATTIGDPEQVLRYENALLGELHILLGRIRLYQDKPEAATRMFQKAETELVSGINPIFHGQARLLAGEITEAANYFETALFDNQFAGIALSELDMLADQLPGKSTTIRAMQQKINAQLISDTRFDTSAVQYHRYYEQINPASKKEQWKQALNLSRKSLKYALINLEKDTIALDWPNQWLNTNLNLSFYLVLNSKDNPQALSESIEIARKSIAWIEEHYFDYRYKDLILTNLAHALWLRNKGNDREEAVRTYKLYLDQKDNYTETDSWDVLQKDFRDVQRAGISWPDLPLLVGSIKPANQ